MPSKIQLSVIIPITESRYGDVRELYFKYKQALDNTKTQYELIYVLDGLYPEACKQLQTLIDDGEINLTIIKFAKYFGEATALKAGFENSSGPLIMTLPAYEQVKPEELPQLVSLCCDKDVDMVISRRWPRLDSTFNRIQSRIFNKIITSLCGQAFKDLGCSVRVFKRRVIDEVQLYGDQHRFLPVLAHQYGFKIREVDVLQSQKDVFQRVYSAGVYVRRLLDLLSVFFLVKFSKKPLRFFGLIGSAIFSLGALSTLYLVIERLFYSVPLADRPALMISTLFIVLGVQVLSIGLIGEIIIFTHAKKIKEYTVDEIINQQEQEHDPRQPGIVDNRPL